MIIIYLKENERPSGDSDNDDDTNHEICKVSEVLSAANVFQELHQSEKFQRKTSEFIIIMFEK